ncbi:hypothetical protein [Streptomyces sp. FIT100]|uniref:hypothetical protein n=1 Tax=Streptomyces sp. FIT100 TaxID=2837956 RepID=UPI0021C9623A|nr:hypothetical protein [Streptomyces sp. FIT100]UUN30288.1 hypothetical protein KK483_31005 [Streptomyces sp. FIT100]
MPIPQMITDRYQRLRAWFAQSAQVADVLYELPANVADVRILCFSPNAPVNMGIAAGQANNALYVPAVSRGQLLAFTTQRFMNEYNLDYPGPPLEYPMPEYRLFEEGPHYYLPVIFVRLQQQWMDNLQDADVNFLSAMVPLHELGHALLGAADAQHQGESYAYWIELKTILHFIRTTVPIGGNYDAPAVGITTSAQAIAGFVTGRENQYAIAKNPAERAVRNTGLPNTIDQIANVLQAAGLPQAGVAGLTQEATRLRQMPP